MSNNGNSMAFPLALGCDYAQGLTKREYFAAMAMQALIAAECPMADVASGAVMFAERLIEQLVIEDAE